MPTWTKAVAGLLAVLGGAYAGSLFFGWPGAIYVLLAAAFGAAVQLIVRGARGIVLAFLLGLASLALPPPYYDSPLRGAPFMSLLLMLFYAPIIAAIAAVTVAVLRGDFRAMKRHGP
jgi:hypothetical protein